MSSSIMFYTCTSTNDTSWVNTLLLSFFMLNLYFFFFFFFQAEDGIRDHCVTGVQTCALPISKFGNGPLQFLFIMDKRWLVWVDEEELERAIAEFREMLRRETNAEQKDR